MLYRVTSKRSSQGKIEFKKALCGILNGWVHDKIGSFMHCPIAEKSIFNFDMFGCENVEFEKNKSKFEQWSELKGATWSKFAVNVAMDLANVIGLKCNSIIKLSGELIVNELIEPKIAEKIYLFNKENPESKESLQNYEKGGIYEDLQSNEGGKVVLTEVPPYFTCQVDDIIKTVKRIRGNIDSSKQTVTEKSDATKRFGAEDFTLNACRFDSFMSVLVFLHETCFEEKDKEEFQLNLPMFSIILQLMKYKEISSQQFRYIAHSILCPGERHTYGPVTEVYDRFKELTGASSEDPSIMSLFTTPYFARRPICSREGCDYELGVRKCNGWDYSFKKFNNWGSLRLNPIEASFIFNVGWDQEYCQKCANSLTHTSYLYSYPNYFSVFCSRDMSKNVQSVTTIDFISIQYRLVSIIYSNYKTEEGPKYSDHFLTIVCKEVNRVAAFFLYDGRSTEPHLLDYKCPLALPNVNQFPTLYESQFQPHLLIYRKVIVNKTVSPKFSKLISISHLDPNEDHYSIQIDLREELSTNYIPDKIELAKFFMMNDNPQTLVRGVAFSSNTSHPKDKLSFVYACMQVFFHNKFFAHEILTSKRESFLLTTLRQFLLMLRYSNSAQIKMNNPWLQRIVNEEDLFKNIMKEVHGGFLDADQEHSKGSRDDLEGMTTICVGSSDLDSTIIDEKNLSTLNIVSILNIGIKDERSRFKERIIFGDKEFMLAGFICADEMNKEREEEQEIKKEPHKIYSAYVMDWDCGAWFQFCFENVVKKNEREIKEILAPHKEQIAVRGGKLYDSDDDVRDDFTLHNEIVYLNYIRCDLNWKNNSEIFEKAFETVSAKNKAVMDIAKKETKELFLPVRSLFNDFCNEQLYIRSHCKHGTCRKLHMKHGNIMPLKYMEACHPADVSSCRKFYNFCPYDAKCTCDTTDLSNLKDTPEKEMSKMKRRCLEELNDLKDEEETPQPTGKILRVKKENK
jgi:hypothetical protein